MKGFWQSWGIAARLLAIIVLPAGIMFAAVTATLYQMALQDVRRDVGERGRIIAAALAQSSQYGLVSGNVNDLRLTLRDLLRADASIARIDITDDTGRAVVADGALQQPPDAIVHTLPIQLAAATPADDLFDPVPAAPSAAPGPARTIGQVRVTMSPAPILQSRQRAMAWALASVLAAAVLSCFVGLKLARRLRETLEAVMAALRAIRQGRFEVRLDTEQAGELGELQRTIVQMADTLHAARHDLEQQVAGRTLELQRAVDQVRRADDEKRRLITHSNAALEEERKRIAADIHDHLGAALISIRLEASALVAGARSMGLEDMEKDARRIASTADGIYGITRNIVKNLRPEIIDTLGLAGAIEELVRNVGQLQSGCRFSFSADKGLPWLRGELAMPAYRITQEAINNIIKHAQASEATVRLLLAPDPHHLRIEIRDDGQGFATDTPGRSGLGLISMRERASAVGGVLAVQSAPGEGTLVQVTFPLSPG